MTTMSDNVFERLAVTTTLSGEFSEITFCEIDNESDAGEVGFGELEHENINETTTARITDNTICMTRFVEHCLKNVVM